MKGYKSVDRLVKSYIENSNFVKLRVGDTDKIVLFLRDRVTSEHVKFLTGKMIDIFGMNKIVILPAEFEPKVVILGKNKKKEVKKHA